MTHRLYKVRNYHTPLCMLAFTFFYLTSFHLAAQIKFQHTYGIGTYNEGRSVKQTFDGGYIIAGTESGAGNGATDVYLLKVDSLGNFQWHKTFGGSGIDHGYSVEQMSDSGYAIAGYTNSFGNGGYDSYLVRTDKNGDTLWTKTYGTSNWDFTYSMKKTFDGGLALAGNSYSNSSGTSSAHLIKINSAGDIQWTKNYAFTDDVFINAITLTEQNGFALAGYKVNRVDGDEDLIVIKVNAAGDTLWTKIIGNSNEEHANAIDFNSNDSSIVAAGYSKDIVSANYDDLQVKLNSNGSINYINLFNEAGEEMINDIHFINNKCIVAAYTTSFGIGNRDAHYYLVDSAGNYITGTTHGGTENDIAYHIELTSDGGYILCGSSTSYAPGLQSVYVLKLDSLFQTSPIVIGINETVTAQSLTNYPNPFHDYTIIKISEINSSKDIYFSVFNMSGENVFSSRVRVQKEIKFFNRELPPGIYIYELHDSEKIFGFGKISIE